MSSTEGELMTAPKITAVQDLIRRLSESPVKGAEWQNRAGGCYAIEIPLPDGRVISVTDREDVFGVNDYESDDEVFGFYVAVYVIEDNQLQEIDTEGGSYIYCTNEDDGTAQCMAREGDKVIDLAAEVGYAYEAITEFAAGN